MTALPLLPARPLDADLANHTDAASIWRYNTKMRHPSGTKPSRILELDLLRGFFIFVIIIDHFQRWPSYFSYITGEGRLWVSAAEGFFIISGLLIGYLRAYKQRDVSLWEVTKLLWKRATLLYAWAVGITFVVVAGLSAFTAGDPLVPTGPNVEQTSSLGTYVGAVLTQTYSNDWIFFLRLYAIMLAISPLFVWLMRTGRWWVVVLTSLAAYITSFFFERPEAALQWQVLFFGAALIGYKLETIRTFLREHRQWKRWLSRGLILLSVVTMVLSYFWVLGYDSVQRYGLSLDYYNHIRDAYLDSWFDNDPMMPARLALSFLWFGGLFALFHHGLTLIQRFFGWLLTLFGTRSLSAYCLQALMLLPVQYFVPITESKLLNTLFTLLFVIGFWGILRLSFVQRFLPK